jgi:predicted DsbA family dithiol-disulfide isomerase
MEIEIWSDIMCPFCYIGKRRLEEALAKFEHAGEIQINWKSFQLNPDMPTMPGKNIIEYLAEIKGWSLEQSHEMHEHVSQMAKEVGLVYDYDKAVVANSFDAHRLIQFAKKHMKGDLAEERLFKAYFTEGKNIADQEVLKALGIEIGLDENELSQVLTSDAFAEEVQQDIYEAQQVGVRGVPFFVLNRKYGISGAQPTAIFLNALNQSYQEWNDTTQATLSTTVKGDSCDITGECN